MTFRVFWLAEHAVGTAHVTFRGFWLAEHAVGTAMSLVTRCPRPCPVCQVSLGALRISARSCCCLVAKSCLTL